MSTSDEQTQAASASPFQSDDLPIIPGYTLRKEIGNGGMGVVYRAHDSALNRPVAIKVMRPGMSARRFVLESQVTAQLPHPGVPPVHALGTTADGRPFLVMKLIDGRTLADELKAVEAAERSRLLGTFERVCEAVGFAHSRGFIHRDLKPSNIMVGAFGEVQVMDWGLAKRVGSGPSATDGTSDSFAAPPPGALDETVAGQAKGTPAFMAPEQARGESVDARADVFALGGVLVVILTGRPPFVGGTAMDVLIKAAQADLAGCYDQLSTCDADDELVNIAHRCLEARPGGRYANGSEVAAAVAAYRAAVNERARRAEQARAAAEARAVAMRKTWKLRLALGAAVVLLLAAGGGFAWYSDHQAERAKRKQAEFDAAQVRDQTERNAIEAVAAERTRAAVGQTRQGVDAGLRLAADLRKQYKFKEAATALAQAAEQAKGSPDLLPKVEQARSDLAFVAQLDDIRYSKWLWSEGVAGQGRFNARFAPAEYRKAFAARGLDLAVLEVAEAAARVAASEIKAELVAAIDDWALHEPDAALQARILGAARRADPGAWTDRLRDPAIWKDSNALRALATGAESAAPSAVAVYFLANLVKQAKLDPLPIVAAGRVKYPTDFGLAFADGSWRAEQKDGHPLGPYEAARALRPDNMVVWTRIACLLHERGDVRAIAAFRRAVQLAPDSAVAHYNLGNVLLDHNDAPGALAAFGRATELDPHYAVAFNNLGGVLAGVKRFDAAIEAYQAAIEIDPQFAVAHTNRGNALWDKGDHAGSLAAHRRAIEIDPKCALAYLNLGVALQRQSRDEDAIVALRRAVQLNDALTLAAAHTSLAEIEYGNRRYTTAAAHARAALKANPKYSNAHGALVAALQQLGDAPGTRAALIEAEKTDPKRFGPMLAQLPLLPVAPPPHEARADLVDDLRRFQGTWKAVMRDAKGNEVLLLTKVIAGTTERVTFAQPGGPAQQVTAFDIKLELRGHEKVYVHFNGLVVEGPNKGQKVPGGFYPYTLSDGTWSEWKSGRPLVWHRVPDATARWPGAAGVQVAPPPRAVNP